ncbi:3-hydroxybutyryl-CoA dehydratase [Polycladomyces abyssicola]|uniref:3-hydroxybutyryl-CoA dehydratase n=1 Tax=Polycladomyces abyssicola TaxID=1125966 RepID=A0A8D5UFK8_9BACL|nr:enoyl-CoA hydratase-related protein [Polycladomyces abyssicola]BCU82586.1 3-hydroxybutyryl-CoA dehydratase [Polycladomyces abyssicola]
MSEKKTILTETADGMGIITINRPEVRNALNSQVIREMREVLQEWRENDQVRLVVFTGAGERSFAAGADIAQLNRRTFQDGLAGGLQGLYDEIEMYEKPTIAAVNGYALGGGCELAMACDLRIAQENAKFGLPELNLSIIPGAGGTQRLARLVGKGRAMDMILTGSVIDAREAERIGLVSRVVSQGQLMEEVRKVADAILSKGPLAVRLAKMVVHTGFETDQRTGLILEKLAQSLLYTTEDMREGTAAFLEKRKPRFKGR